MAMLNRISLQRTRKLVFTFALLLSPVTSMANAADADATIHQLYQNAPNNTTLIERLKYFSNAFKGKKYVFGALGEGADGQFDQSPLYRTDAFDCQTYVSTTLALANAKDLADFKQRINQVRYANGTVSYLGRNHFTSIDWNTNNLHKGFIKDITYTIVDKQGKPVAVVADAIINKPNWYAFKKARNIKLDSAVSEQEKEQRAAKLRSLGKQLTQEKSVMLYIPLQTLFENGKANTYLFNQIPDGSIIEIIRPNWDVADKVGTNLNVSHLGFAIRTPQGLMFREASLVEGKVIDVPLDKYLKTYLTSPTVKGINIQKVT